ncbi:FAD-dependent monooxygenase [Tianweitania populi]|nr:FAD-dependent monooxygenase [Tianweitania populi]
MQKKPEGEQDWDNERMKQFLREWFATDRWHFPRILDGMLKTQNLYFDVLRQVRIARWSIGRMVLAGDAAWCATPLSGIGTQLAFVGGYVLAGKLAKTDDVPSALAAYDRIMRPVVKEGQGVPKIVPRMLWPHSRLGRAALREVMRVAGWPFVRKTFAKLYLRDSKRVFLPNYREPAPTKA